MLVIELVNAYNMGYRLLSMGMSYDEVQEAITNCDKAITFARKEKVRDKPNIAKLRIEHHQLTAKLGQMSPDVIEEKRDSKSEFQDTREEPRESSKDEKKGFKDKIKEKISKD